MKPNFEDLVNTYQEEIFAYLWRILFSAEDAEDCLQETFLKAFTAYSRFQEPGNPRAWLYRIATNSAFTRLKREKVVREKYSELALETATQVSSVAEQAERRWLLAEVRRAVDALPDRQRSAFILRKYQALSYKEIAAALDCSQEAARAHVYQALKKLRQQFAAQEVIS